MIDKDYYNQIVKTTKAVFDGTDNQSEEVKNSLGINDLSKVNAIKLASKKPVSKIVRKKARRRNQLAA